MRVEIPDELKASLEEIAGKTGQDLDSLVAEMVTEAIKMRRVPGILFADGPRGRRARIGGTGIEVFEVINVYVNGGCDREDLSKQFDWLSDYQLNMAIAYYETYPEDVKPLLSTEEENIAAIKALWERIPQTSPDWPGRLAQVQKPAGSASRESA